MLAIGSYSVPVRSVGFPPLITRNVDKLKELWRDGVAAIVSLAAFRIDADSQPSRFTHRPVTSDRHARKMSTLTRISVPETAARGPGISGFAARSRVDREAGAGYSPVRLPAVVGFWGQPRVS